MPCHGAGRILWLQVPYQTYACKHVLLLRAVLPLTGRYPVTHSVKFCEVRCFLSCCMCFWCHSYKVIACSKATPIFPSQSLPVLVLMFGSVIHFGLIFIFNLLRRWQSTQHLSDSPNTNPPYFRDSRKGEAFAHGHRVSSRHGGLDSGSLPGCSRRSGRTSQMHPRPPRCAGQQGCSSRLHGSQGRPT